MIGVLKTLKISINDRSEQKAFYINLYQSYYILDLNYQLKFNQIKVAKIGWINLYAYDKAISMAKCRSI